MPRRKLNGGNDNVTADVEKMIDDQIEIELSKLRQGQTLSGSGSADPDDQQDIKEPLDIEYITNFLDIQSENIGRSTRYAKVKHDLQLIIKILNQSNYDSDFAYSMFGNAVNPGVQKYTQKNNDGVFISDEALNNARKQYYDPIVQAGNAAADSVKFYEMIRIGDYTTPVPEVPIKSWKTILKKWSPLEKDDLGKKFAKTFEP